MQTSNSLSSALKLVDRALWPVLAFACAVAILAAFAHKHLIALFGEYPADVLVNIAFSIIAAFVFYFFVDVIRRDRESRSLAPYVSRNVELLKGDVIAVCRGVARAVGVTLPQDWQFDQGDVDRLFGRATGNMQANLVFLNGQKATLMDYVFERANRSDSFLRNLSEIGVFLGGDGMALIAEIRTGMYLAMIKGITPIRSLVGGGNLSFLAEALGNHYQLVRKFERWTSERGLCTSPWAH